MNDNERQMWVLNDEGLYNWYISSRIGLTRFVRENRQEIDKYINRVLK